MKINTRKISRWRWEISCRYWQMRRSLLNWIFHYLNLVRCHLVTEQRLKEPPEPDAVVRALGGGRYARYSLHQGHRELATLVEYDVDFPWIFCHCTVTPAFEAVRSEFEGFSEAAQVWKAAQAMGSPEGYRVWRRALRRVQRLRLKLVPLELPGLMGPSPTLLYIDGEKARFRTYSSPNVTSWPW